MLKNYIFTLCLTLCSVALCDTQEDIVTLNTVDISTLPPRPPEIETSIKEINKAINELNWVKILQGDMAERGKFADVGRAISQLKRMEGYNPERDSIDLNSARTKGEIKAKPILNALNNVKSQAGQARDVAKRRQMDEKRKEYQSDIDTINEKIEAYKNGKLSIYSLVKSLIKEYLPKLEDIKKFKNSIPKGR